MYYLLLCLLLHTPAQRHDEPARDTVIHVTPLSEYSAEWNDEKYRVCNTAANASYLSDREKEVIYILNMIRMNPRLFCESVMKPYPVSDGHKADEPYYVSLLDTLQRLNPMPILYPDSICYVSAQCHAFQSGLSGYVGHSRYREAKCKEHFRGECCDYGTSDALDILIDLLIDEDEPSMGHRYICLGDYKKLGVSIEKHKLYKYTAVMDFY